MIIPLDIFFERTVIVQRCRQKPWINPSMKHQLNQNTSESFTRRISHYCPAGQTTYHVVVVAVVLSSAHFFGTLFGVVSTLFGPIAPCSCRYRTPSPPFHPLSCIRAPLLPPVPRLPPLPLAASAAANSKQQQAAAAVSSSGSSGSSKQQAAALPSFASIVVRNSRLPLCCRRSQR